MKPTISTPKYDLYLADCLDVMREMEAGSVDAVITDPPYGEVNRGSNGLRNLDRGNADKADFDEFDLLKIFNRLTNVFYIWCGIEQISKYKKESIRFGYSFRCCVWEKTNPSPINGEFIWLSSIELCAYGKRNGAIHKRFCASPVWKMATEPREDHPTAKPIKLMTQQIIASTNSNNTVLDPFMGSGTTGVACMQLGRKFIGVEIDPKYFEIAEKRIRQAAMQEPLFTI